MINEPWVIIGTPVCRQGDYALDKFLTNQKAIQNVYPSSELVLTTSETDFSGELASALFSRGLRGRVLRHTTNRPDYARSRIWDIAGGRENLRQYFLSRPEARQLLFLDADMTFDPEVIKILQKEVRGYAAVFSGYPLRQTGLGLAGAGCILFTRDVLEKITFRCLEFRNGEVISEDNLIEMDLFGHGRFRKGFFLAIDHYFQADTARSVVPRPVGPARRMLNNNLLRYILIKASVTLHYDIPEHLKALIGQLFEKNKEGKEAK
jgi:hypothetical protein